MARIPNRQIVKELKEGDRLGCVHLAAIYHYRLIGEAMDVFEVAQPDAEELTNDVLLAVVEKIGTFEFKRADGDFHFWVMTIFRNKVRDFLRHQSLTDGLMESYQEASLEDEEEYSLIEREVVVASIREYERSLRRLEEWEEDEDEDSEEAGGLRAVVDVLDRLETWERVLLRCRALDVPYEDIARYTGKPVHQLKVYHARVKKKFVKLLAENHGEPLVYET